MNPRTPTLAELQRAVRRSLSDGVGVGADAADWVLPDGLTPDARLRVYRNTSASVLRDALRLAFPATQRLVGAAFFDGAAGLFARASLPASAWLDEYGAEFPGFLARMPEAACVPYLADVARLEWQVDLALHAPDVAALDLARLARLDEPALRTLRLRPHPAARLLRCAYPVDAIWRAVLEQDDRALRRIRLDDGPVHLLAQRTDDGVDVLRLGEADWRVACALFAGEPIDAAFANAPQAGAHALFATLLSRGCFADTAAQDGGIDSTNGGSRS
ncbi:DNA-binding domain-containing protein [Burkholderia oklahomensis]|uniref:HvfC/BufC N-terminal domain-containing protein n=1 Tax=Burkholderia oklahomensis TaxID=342113 RepID=UPI00016A8720|nr:DNA-binding domain-containing protein [Burkholderia oklahomensis]AJX34951.1 hypothetical protein BG90_5429 [Burkholderia oklahomensis C6786]AOI49075.1 hypothetical protein WI23_25090 [Burkholderia oklahomensis C6786]KUY60876.1 hypothetical protein WI23_14405 [Burkholderia oklahomensis C6786]MBI0362694.1 putative DNA-binding domain-containing protein [Burkholderia oklahomensis]SUY26802.1 Uncharacterized protein conserved in bacteria [Burkholderia oklahomensis]